MAQPGGCDHETIAHWLRGREVSGGLSVSVRRQPTVDSFAETIKESIDHSGGERHSDTVATA
jgi:hypothetical protein